MAKAKKVSKSAASSDSNTGIIITLVFFVLTTLTLGVFTYFGYDGQREYADKEKKAQTDARNANKARDEAIAAQKATAAENIKLKESELKAIQDRDNARRDTDVAKNSLTQATSEYESSKKALNDNLAKATENTTKAQNTALDDLSKERAKHLGDIKQIDGVSEALKTERQGRADDNASADQDKKKLADQNRSVKEQLKVAQSKIAPPNSIDSDTPKGAITRVNREMNTVYINLGSADYLRPQVTFSVWDAGTSGKTAAARDRKGNVEVIRVMGPSLSEARIVEVASEFRDPLVKGDLLFNPSWNSGQREHVALVGVFDLDGDGNDDTPEVIRNLQKQGIVVDAWLDLKDRTIKGPGITERTTFLVQGETPKPSDATAKAGPDTPLMQIFTQVGERVAKMEQMAQDKGVQPVSYRRYLTLIGYQLPKLAKPVDPTSTAYVRQAAVPTPPPEAAPAKEEKPKDEKPKADKAK